jgi:serine protease Do
MRPFTPLTATDGLSLLLTQQGALERLYARVCASVVAIHASGTAVTEPKPRRGQLRLVPPRWTRQGSGFVYDRGGTIVTSCQAVAGADTIQVRFDNNTVEPATLLGADLLTNIAVLQVATLPDGTVPRPLAAEEDLRVGRTVLALGRAFSANASLAVGILSSVNHFLPERHSPGWGLPLFEISTPIHAGNAGEPLLDLSGALVGVNLLVQPQGDVATGVGFAVPALYVTELVSSLLSGARERSSVFGGVWASVSESV